MVKTVWVSRRVIMFVAHAYFWVMLLSGVLWSLLALLFAFGPWDPPEACGCDEALVALEAVDWTGTGDSLTFTAHTSPDGPVPELALRSASAVVQSTPTIVLPFDASRARSGSHYDRPAGEIGARLIAAGAEPRRTELDGHRSYRFQGVTVDVTRVSGVEVIVRAPDASVALAAADALAAELGTAVPARFTWLPGALSNLFRITAPLAWFGFWGLRAWRMRTVEGRVTA